MQGMNITVATAFIDQGEPRLDQFQVNLLRETAEECGPEMLQELLDLFTEDSSVRVAQIGIAISRNDLEEVAGLAHSLAGSSANLGGNRLAKLSSLLEGNILKGHLDELEAIAGQIELEFDYTLAALNDFVAST